LNRLAAVALGSNVGERAAHLDYAISRLSTILQDIRISSSRETEPVDVPDAQGSYLNAAVVGTTALSARELLDRLLALEQERGRTRPHVHAARTLDLDLILLGDLVVSEPGLVVPHPRFRERRFVLEPLAEIAPDMRDPVTGLTITELLRKVER
jgi:2-amino-4-hydroxy-6-hydroxymethyldihydropteridine diphosphokinase